MREEPTYEELKQRIGVLEEAESKRLIAEAALRQKKAFAESLVNTAQVIVLVLDRDARILHLNPYLEKISGYKFEEVQGKDWFTTFIPGRDHDRIRKMFNQAVADIQTRGYVNSIVTRDGVERQIEWYDKTLRDDGDKIVGILAVGLDITDRLRSEKAAREQKHLLETVIKTTPGILALQDCESVYKSVNPAFCEFIGKPANEIVGRKSQDLLPPEEADRFHRVDAKVIDSGTPLYQDMEVTGHGGTRWLQVTKTPIMDRMGCCTSLLFSANDITERKLLEKSLEDARNILEQKVTLRTKELSETNASLKALLDRRSVEIRSIEQTMVANLKRFVFPYIDMLEQRIKEKEMYACIQAIRTNIEQLISPISKKLSSAYAELSPTEIKVADLIRQGKSTKSISTLLRVSTSTVENHRNNIRRKFKLLNKKTNLYTYLISLD